jgi:hypothetical protein
MTAAFLKSKNAQANLKKPKEVVPDNKSDISDDMANQRNPTYSHLYDAKLRTVSEYENPYDVSRRGTVAPGDQQQTQANLDAQNDIPLVESQYI